MAAIIIDNNHDAEMRLRGSVVTFGGIPVYVSDSSTEHCRVHSLVDGEEQVVDTDKLNLEPVQLGNAVSGDSYVYLQRIPARRWKQGLVADSINCGKMPWEHRGVELRGQALGNCIVNKYVDPAEAMEEVLSCRKTASPFSRKWGFGTYKGVPYILHKGEKVGVVDGGITLFKEFAFLKEDLLGVLNA